MLGRAEFQSAVHQLGIASKANEDALKKVTRQAELLLAERRTIAASTVPRVEAYLSELANAPREFDNSVGEFRIESDRFDDVVQRFQKAETQGLHKGAGMATAGGVAGLGVAALGPTAAMAIATTFGTASTGTAISLLSGAAATNAALAWLGGGALAAGGAGMAGGNALLALAGPVGWAIAGTLFIGGGVVMRNHYKKNLIKVQEARVTVDASTRALMIAEEKATGQLELIQRHNSGVIDQLMSLQSNAPKDYRSFTDDQKRQLGALINNIQSLSPLLTKTIE